MQENKWKKEMPEIPDNVHKAVLNALDKIETINLMTEKGMVKNMENRKETLPKHTVRKIIRPTMAVAACAALVLTTTIFHSQFGGNSPNGEQTSQEDSALSNLAEVFPGFSITAHAAELDMVETDGANLVFVDTGSGEGGYSGMLFRIQGDDISEVKLSLDKGELYVATMENTTEDALTDWLAQGSPDMDNNPDTHTVMKMISQNSESESETSESVQLYHCIKKGSEIFESYNDEIYYGFYIPDNTLSSVSDEGDLASAYQEMLEVFEGSELKITVVHNDGTISEKGYVLSVEKLMQDESGMITQEVCSGGSEGAFVYGILGEEK